MTGPPPLPPPLSPLMHSPLTGPPSLLPLDSETLATLAEKIKDVPEGMKLQCLANEAELLCIRIGEKISAVMQEASTLACVDHLHVALGGAAPVQEERKRSWLNVDAAVFIPKGKARWVVVAAEDAAELLTWLGGDETAATALRQKLGAEEGTVQCGEDLADGEMEVQVVGAVGVRVEREHVKNVHASAAAVSQCF